MVPLAPPSGPKEGPLQTTSSKEQERTPSSSARLSGRGRALPTPASTSPRKPGQPDEVYSPASQQSVDEMMDESVSPSDDDLLPSDMEPTTWLETAAETSTVDEDVVTTLLNLMRMVIARVLMAAARYSVTHDRSSIHRLTSIVSLTSWVQIR
ncbi:hypothetical protein HPB47_016621 [Ixodes persulcatus]|uniref:Uncharacterized protein n=1 Tax=Ixodes persulcatus TaxID=34615 RepID=A0AC60QSG6_IXOPE|nr:hypothetical protein HPB47_016621 [Ixodes persulcatus]